jgi:hypothetical protein
VQIILKCIALVRHNGTAIALLKDGPDERPHIIAELPKDIGEFNLNKVYEVTFRELPD